MKSLDNLTAKSNTIYKYDKEMLYMAKKKLVVPEAREAFEQFKMEIANEFGEDDPRNLASKHTGMIVRELVKQGENQLINKNK